MERDGQSCEPFQSYLYGIEIIKFYSLYATYYIVSIVPLWNWNHSFVKLILLILQSFNRTFMELKCLLVWWATDGVLIHIGNTAKDTEGCILVGENKQVGMVLNSTVTFKRVYDLMKKADLRGETIKLRVE